MLSFTKRSNFSTVQIMLLVLACSCNSIAGSKEMCIQREKQALLDFKKGFDIESSFLISSWGAKGVEDCCQWQGVQCSNQTGHVVSLQLGHAGLNGTIRDSLLELRHLRHLDLRGNSLEDIPPFIGSLSKLIYLNLSQVHYPVTRTIPSQIANLSSLQVLDLGYSSNIQWYSEYIYHPAASLGDFYGLMSNNLRWLSQLSSLRYLDLAHVDLSQAADWLQPITMLPYLEHLALYDCHLPLPKPIPFSPKASVKYLSRLTFARLGSNHLNSSIFDWFSNITTNLTHLDLRGNEFSGQVPILLCNINSLMSLDLSDNSFEGDIPADLLHRLPNLVNLSIARNKFSGLLPELQATGNISLQSLDLSSNGFVGPIPEFLGNIASLTKLNLSNNGFKGRIPKSLRKLHNLQLLDLSSNGLSDIQFNVSFLESIGQLSNLIELDLSNNSLHGTISEIHFRNLSHLTVLDMSENSFLTLNISQGWCPPFQLTLLMFGSCNIGPQFPTWIQTQTRLSTLDLSNSMISDSIPDWFWEHFRGSNIEYLNLSYNKIYGSMPNNLLLNSTHFARTIIDLSHNLLSGLIPPDLMNSTTLSLSSNLFSGSISTLCAAPKGGLMALDLSNNFLSGELPDCWSRWGSLNILNLANNSFFGKVPESIGSLSFLRALHLRKNGLHGQLPSSMMNCSSLQVLDLAENNFFGGIPAWIGEKLNNLLVLSFRLNRFRGKIPQSLCQLSSLHVLDLSLNRLSGSIPKCFENFSAMSQGWSFDPYFVQPICLGYSFWGSAQYADILLLEVKGIERELKSKSVLINFIDLSHNMLTGEIPSGLTSLVYLISLNLSRNHLTGEIPYDIGHIRQLDALDLSRNQLHGEIPSSLSNLDLGSLDLSHNHLSGHIPRGTQLQSFEASVYAGNPELCGPPLEPCPEDENSPPLTRPLRNHENQATDDDAKKWVLHFFISMLLGFTVGFFGVFSIFIKSLRTQHPSRLRSQNL